MYVNSHVLKILVESLQLLCSAHHLHPNGYTPIYKLTHRSHPCSKWVRESLTNFQWLHCLALELCKEYTYRYGKIHKCEQYLKEMTEPSIPDIGFTTPPQCMPDEYKDDDVVKAYRTYYKFGKAHLHLWKMRPIPSFISE